MLLLFVREQLEAHLFSPFAFCPDPFLVFHLLCSQICYPVDVDHPLHSRAHFFSFLFFFLFTVHRKTLISLEKKKSIPARWVRGARVESSECGDASLACEGINVCVYSHK